MHPFRAPSSSSYRLRCLWSHHPVFRHYKWFNIKSIVRPLCFCCFFFLFIRGEGGRGVVQDGPNFPPSHLAFLAPTPFCWILSLRLRNVEHRCVILTRFVSLPINPSSRPFLSLLLYFSRPLSSGLSPPRSYNGNRSKWSAIWSEIIRVISKSDERAARVWFKITRMILDQNSTTRSSITTLLQPFWIHSVPIFYCCSSCSVEERKEQVFYISFCIETKNDVIPEWWDANQKWRDLEHEWRNLEQTCFGANNSGIVK